MQIENNSSLRLDLFDAEAQGAAETGETQAGSDDARQSETVEERTADTDALRREFDELIRGKYKDVYTEKTQAMINRKYAKAKAQAEENAGLRELTGLFARKLGLQEDGDPAALRAAAEALPDREPDAPGDAEAQTREQAERWLREANTLRERYPDFELRAELEDPAFVAAIQAGVPMELLYRGRHFDRLLSDAAKTAEENVVQSIRAKGGRPAENGAGANNSPILTKSDPSQLILREFEQIARRVSRGERITF